MKAEERLTYYCEGHDWEEGCRLAREAIKLLREVDFHMEPLHGEACPLHQFNWSGWSPGEPEPVCKCGTWEYGRKVRRFLDGEGGDGTA